jgi:hypothetical protein
VDIPNSVSEISWFAFRGCSSLKSITIPNTVTKIGQYAFEGCSSLANIEIPNNVTEIERHAFENCISLSSINIPKSVTHIEENAFDGIDFKSVFSFVEEPFEINRKIVSSRTFSENTYDNAILYVPEGSINKYIGTRGWSDFVNIKEFDPTGMNRTVLRRKEDTSIYDLNGRSMRQTQKGVNIIDGKKIFVK